MLKELRENKGFSIQDLSMASGVSEQTIHSLENGEADTINSGILTALAGALSVSASAFFE